MEDRHCEKGFPSLKWDTYFWTLAGYFPWNSGCLIGILRMICYNPHITGYYNPLYTLNNQVFFIAQVTCGVLSYMTALWFTQTKATFLLTLDGKIATLFNQSNKRCALLETMDKHKELSSVWLDMTSSKVIIPTQKKRHGDAILDSPLEDSGRHFQSVQTADFWAFPAAVAAYDLSKYRWQPIASCGGQVQQIMT